MTWNPRLAIVEALEEAGWSGDEENPLGLLRHGEAVWGVTSPAGDSSLTERGGAVVDFPADTSAALIVAACLVASGQAGDQAAELKRLRLALSSAKRRAKRRLPHEREGLIFHLERQNDRLYGLAQIANAAAEVSAKGWDDARREAGKLREMNGRLRTRIADAEARLEAVHGDVADQLVQEGARRRKVAWSPMEVTAAAEWGDAAAFVRSLTGKQASDETPAQVP
ncbi:hypothetical protein OG272_16135 [Streptomyces sp. NBC_00104]|uniref:hypothetical protein n=1 Tax=Streptomyces sp. NBC_00104 TaxID=2903621 RepID=UPI00324390BE